jgi:hypothetical protein
VTHAHEALRVLGGIAGGTRIAKHRLVRARVSLALAAIYTALPSLASAHPDHGSTESGTWSHYFGEPLHIAVFGAGLAGLALARIALGGDVHHRHR